MIKLSLFAVASVLSVAGIAYAAAPPAAEAAPPAAETVVLDEANSLAVALNDLLPVSERVRGDHLGGAVEHRKGILLTPEPLLADCVSIAPRGRAPGRFQGCTLSPVPSTNRLLLKAYTLADLIRLATLPTAE